MTDRTSTDPTSIGGPVDVAPGPESEPNEPVRYLSSAWLAEADRVLADLEPLPERLVVGYRVTGGSDGPGTPDSEAPICHAHHLVLGPDRVSLGPGIDHADLILGLDWEVAVAIHRGETAAQRAVLDGRITVTGDPAALLGHQAQLAGVDDRLAGLRSRTVYR